MGPRRELDALGRHTVSAAQIAKLGKRNAQVGVLPSKGVLQYVLLIFHQSCLAPFNTPNTCNTDGNMASMDSFAPLVDPGSAKTKV